MTAKEYLSQAYKIKNILNANRSRINDLCDLAEFLETLQQIDNIAGDQLSGQTNDVITALRNTCSEVHSDIKRLLEIQEEIISVIHAVECYDCKVILYERYVNFKRWDEIAGTVNYSLRYVHKLHGKGLAAVGDILFLEHSRIE